MAASACGYSSQMKLSILINQSQIGMKESDGLI